VIVSLAVQQYFLQGKSPQYPSYRVWMGYSAGLDALSGEKFFAPAGNETIIPW